MKTVFTNNQATKLIVYFAGWGTPAEIVGELALSKEYDLLVCYDYQDLILEFDFKPYQQIHLVAWSLGIWVAERVVSKLLSAPLLDTKLVSATAINGTGLPINDQQGIPVELFKATLAGLTPASRKKFERRMCNTLDDLHQYQQYPSRDFTAVTTELAFLFEQIRKDQRTDLLQWKKAIIGTSDRIFSPQNQANYWQDRCKITYVESGHYLFNQYQQWEQLWV